MTVDERSAYIKRKQLCLNCFARGHYLGSNFNTRALIDSGSEATFISERLLKLIKLPHQVIRAQVSGLNKTESAESKKLCQFTIRSPTRPGLQINTTAYALHQLAGNLPSCPILQQFLRDLQFLGGS